MTRRSRVAVLLGVVMYALLGLAYNDASKACSEARHARDSEPEVDGGVGAAFYVVLWPVYLVADWATDTSCVSGT